MAEHDELIAGTTNVLSLMRSPTFGVKAFLDEFIIERIEALTAALGEADAENARLRAGNTALAERMHENGVERDALRAKLGAALAFINDPGNWGAMDGRGKLLAAILNGEEPNNAV